MKASLILAVTGLVVGIFMFRNDITPANKIEHVTNLLSHKVE
jgi:hypothetical protein